MIRPYPHCWWLHLTISICRSNKRQCLIFFPHLPPTHSIRDKFFSYQAKLPLKIYLILISKMRSSVCWGGFFFLSLQKAKCSGQLPICFFAFTPCLPIGSLQHYLPCGEKVEDRIFLMPCIFDFLFLF